MEESLAAEGLFARGFAHGGAAGGFEELPVAGDEGDPAEGGSKEGGPHGGEGIEDRLEGSIEDGVSSEGREALAFRCRQSRWVDLVNLVHGDS